MRTNYRILLLAAITIFAGSLAASAQSSRTGNKVPADLLITLKRTICYGTCPAYTLTINAKGRVTFTGEEFTRVKGKATGRIKPAQVRELVKRFEAAGFSTLKQSYNSEDYCEPIMTDVPSETISLKAGGVTKSVNHYFGCTGESVREETKRISALGAYIDEVTGSKRWIAKK